MSRSANQRRRLEALEHDFRVALIDDLRHVKDGNDTVYFIVERLLPDDYFSSHHLSRRSAARWAESETIFELRALLGDPTDGTPLTPLHGQ